MRKVLLLEHVSLDGFLAGPNGEMDWIHVEEELWDYVAALTKSADTAVFGRVTYQMMEGYWPTAAENPGATRHDIDHAQWVNNATKLVFSRTIEDVSWENTRVVSGDIAGTIREMKAQPGANLLMIGSAGLAREFLRLRLIDELWLNVNPVILGSGIPLFDEQSGRTDLKLASSRIFESGVVGLCYEV